MSVADEIERLSQLHQSGALTDAEFAAAKRRLIGGNVGGPDSLGQAANRYVSFSIVMGIIGVVIFLFMLFAVILPQFRSFDQDFNRPPSFSLPVGPGR